MALWKKKDRVYIILIILIWYYAKIVPQEKFTKHNHCITKKSCVVEMFYCSYNNKLTVISVIPECFNVIPAVITVMTPWTSHHHQFSNWRFAIESTITRAVSWNISWIKKEWDQFNYKLLAIPRYMIVWLMIKVIIAVNEYKQCIHSRNRLAILLIHS